MDEIKKFWTSIPSEQQKSLLRLNLEDVRTRARSLDSQSKQDSGKRVVRYTFAAHVPFLACSLVLDPCSQTLITTIFHHRLA